MAVTLAQFAVSQVQASTGASVSGGTVLEETADQDEENVQDQNGGEPRDQGATWQDSPWYPGGHRHCSTSSAWARPL